TLALLLFEHFALHVSTLLAHFNSNSLCLAGRTGGLDGALGLALERNLLRLSVRCTVGFAQMRQQLLLLVIRDHLSRVLMRQPGVLHLRKQRVYRNADHISQCFYGCFCHIQPTCSCSLLACSPVPAFAQPADCSSFSNHGARAVIITSAAGCSSLPSISSRSSTACSARSSMVTMPRDASVIASSRVMPSMLSRSSAGADDSSFSSDASARVNKTSLARWRNASTMSSSNASIPSISSTGT